MKKNAWQMPNSFLSMRKDSEQDNGHFSVSVLRKSGTVSVKTVHKEYGTIWLKGCCWGLQKADVQISALQVHCPEVVKSTSPAFRGSNGKLLGGIPPLRPHQDDGLDTDRAGKPATISDWANYSWNDFHKEFVAKFTVIISVTVNEVHCHRWVVERVHLQIQKITTKMATRTAPTV